jgi:hypothetical protein
MTDWTTFANDISTAAGSIISYTYDFDGTNSTEIYLPDPLIDWLPYKVEKYIPTWHLVRSYK